MKHFSIIFLAGLVLMLTSSMPIEAQSGGSYDLSWRTIDGGGGISSGGQYTLTGTIGQPDAAWSAGGQYELLGGFWPGGPLCFVDFESYAIFAEWWLEEECNELNNSCGGANLDEQDGVNFDDLKLLLDEWLEYCPYGWSLK